MDDGAPVAEHADGGVGHLARRAVLGGMDDEARKSARLAIPLRRFGKPEEVAAAVYFLAGRDAAYITGAALKIDGGIF